MGRDHPAWTAYRSRQPPCGEETESNHRSRGLCSGLGDMKVAFPMEAVTACAVEGQVGKDRTRSSLRGALI